MYDTLHKQIAKTLGFWGPMNAAQIHEKLSQQGKQWTLAEVTQQCESHCDEFRGVIKPAIGFDVPTYKVSSIDSWQTLP